MAVPMRVSIRYGSHLPLLMAAVQATRGPVLELGAGVFSTPILHWLCTLAERELVTYDNDMKYLNWAHNYANEYHALVHVANWGDADIERPWAVALVDHSPSERRVVEIKRLAPFARYIVVHDTNGRYERHYHYSTIWPLFPYHYTYAVVEPGTTVLSALGGMEPIFGRLAAHLG